MLLALTLTTVCLFLVLVYILLVVLSPSIPTPGPEAFKYRSNSEPTIAYPLPSSTAPAECDLSVVIPAYNEAKRLPPMLTEALNHVLGNKLWRSVEFLIVDDGIKLPQNSGKGSAVKHGMLHARGERMLMVDADGASKFSDLDKLWDAMDNGADVVCGSRAHLVGTDAVVKRSFIRNTLMYGLHTLLRFLGVSHIRDTQCGFKLFTRPAAHTLFQTLHIPHWIFDVELLVVALMCGMKTDEVAVGWHEVAGSKINILWDTLEMLRDLLVLRANYVTGRWKVVRVDNAQTNGSAGNGHVTDLENKSAANLRRRVVDATQK
ncbi:glycosyltransferase family 2 protein [Rhizoctonia solani]|uniref:dolichyl-phosphate beta-glucosyltransferase n=1 Tax=Rhizoctonia solani TaxID=456999 RepID=A0A8H8SUI9_9AGAM|nr:glycosyltransferase family 2 protein [Rhizoctonia solani]QRW17442.1 glycosyltransferase family 2 protein [Rhizoctonia solani]